MGKMDCVLKIVNLWISIVEMVKRNEMKNVITEKIMENINDLIHVQMCVHILIQINQDVEMEK
jgi:hypothetical protein